MTREQQYWEDTQEALSRVFDRCEEIDPQSDYDMLEDIQFIRGFINKHRPRTEKQEPIIDKIRAEIEQGYCEVNNDYDHGRNYGLYMATQIIDKYQKIREIAFPLQFCSTDKLEHEAIMKICEVVEDGNNYI